MFLVLRQQLQKRHIQSFQALGLSVYAFLLSRYTACPVLFISVGRKFCSRISQRVPRVAFEDISSMAVTFQRH